MKVIAFDTIAESVASLCVDAACDLPTDVETALRAAREREASHYGAYALEKICKNIDIAREGRDPICQDTGMVVVFAEVGNDVRVEGGLLEDAINEGIARGYTQGYLRKSTVDEPLFSRLNRNDNTPAVIHTRFAQGDSLSIALLPKGAGSENMSALKMLKPAQGKQGVVDFVVEAVEAAGGNPCPPIIVGVGIGGNAEMAIELSKRALLRETGVRHPDAPYAELEEELLARINETGIGPQGFGGLVTALDVHVEHFPTHIAMLPVGVTINCHAARHKKVIL